MDDVVGASPQARPQRQGGSRVLAAVRSPVERQHVYVDVDAPQVFDLVADEAPEPGFGRSRIHVGERENLHAALFRADP